MDDWLHEPGARVEGHRAVVRGDGEVMQTSCSCGRPFPALPSVQGACLTLVHHLSEAVRNGARVVRGGDGDGGSTGAGGPPPPSPPRGSGRTHRDIA